MNKIEIINEILNIYEENRELKNKIEFLTAEKNVESEIETQDEPKEKQESLEKRIYKIGLKTLFEEAFNGSYMSKGWNDKKYPTLEKWSNDSINLKKYEEFSIKEFKSLYGDKIKNAYDKALEEAIERDKKEEDE